MLWHNVPILTASSSVKILKSMAVTAIEHAWSVSMNKLLLHF